MGVKVLYRGKEMEFPEKRIRVRDLLRKMNLSPLSTIVVKGEEILSEDDYVEEGDSVRVVNAISGGT